MTTEEATTDISFAELLDVVVVFINIVVVDDPSVIDVVASSVVILDSVVDVEPKKKQIVVYANLFKPHCVKDISFRRL
jgi:hypothetical protein